MIFDNRVAMTQFDYFTFNNIRGRSGRMFEHYVGKVFIFHEPPFVELPFVDFPALTQPESAPDSLLVQLDREELTERSRERIQPFFDNELLPLSVLRANSGVDPQVQLDLAAALHEDPGGYAAGLVWHGTPVWEELSVTCSLIWEFLVEGRGMQAGVASGPQLAFKLMKLGQHGPSAQLILELWGRAESADDAVEETLDFVRQWAGFRFPRLLMALDAIQREVFQLNGMQTGDYSVYAAQVENLFLASPLVALDEYGIPYQVAQKLVRALRPDGDLDAVLERLAALELDRHALTTFEQQLVAEAQSTLLS